MKKYKAVLFDLDGTINDSGPGIMNSCRYAMEKMGYEQLPEETMRKFVGPSLLYSFRTFCGMSEEEAERVAKLLQEEMENAVKLRVPLVAESGVGYTWYETK